MSSMKANSVIRYSPSLRDVAFLVPLAVIFARKDGVSTLLEGDTGWHIRTGEWILANRAVPRVDMFSFTKAGEPWFAWEWLWDLGAAWLHQLGGMPAVIFAGILLLCVTSALLFGLVSRRCGNPVVAIAVCLAAVIGGSIHWYVRPHLFTLFFTLIFCWILDRAAEGKVRLLWLLPAITVLWTNLHGGFLVGLILIAAYAAGSLLAGGLAVAPDSRSQQFQGARRYALAAAGCFAATFVNPYAWHLHAHIWKYLTESYHREHITEFMSISFNLPLVPFFEALLLLGVMAAAWNVYKRRFTWALLLLGWSHLALLMARNIPIFLIVAAPVIAVSVEEWIERLARANVPARLQRSAKAFSAAAAEFALMDRLPRVPVLSAAASVLLFALLFAPSPSRRLLADYNSRVYPVRAIEALKELGVSRTYTDDEWGDYLIYRLYPRKKVFIDGRSDFYGPEFGNSFLLLLGGEYTWRREFSRWNIDSVLLPVKSPLAATLKESRDWQVHYDDGIAILFMNPTAKERPSAEAVHTEFTCDRKIAKELARDRNTVAQPQP